MVLVCGVAAGELFFEGDAAGRTVCFDDLRGGPDDPDAVRGGGVSGFDEERCEQFGEEVGPQAIHAHVRFIPLLGGAADRRLRDSGVVPEDVEAGFLGEEVAGALGDGGEIVQVQSETFELRRVAWWRRRSGRLDLLDCGGDSVGRAARDVDGAAALGVEHFDELESNASVAACDDDDFAVE